MKTKAQSLVSLLLAVCMVLTLSLGLTGCGSAKATTPRLRINPENNYWEVSYDDGSTWESMNVAATGVAGKDGKDGVNGKDGTNGTNGTSQSGSRSTGPGSPPEGASVRSPVTRSLCVFTPYGVQV